MKYKKANIKRLFDNAERQGHDRKKLVYINSGGTSGHLIISLTSKSDSS